MNTGICSSYILYLYKYLIIMHIYILLVCAFLFHIFNIAALAILFYVNVNLRTICYLTHKMNLATADLNTCISLRVSISHI
jgi:hypothetical protein